MLVLVAVALIAQTSVQPSSQTSVAPALAFRTTVAVLAFSDDGNRALLKETTTAGPTTQTALLIADDSGVRERLPLSNRTDGLRADRVDGDVCRASADRTAELARDFRGVSVVIGLCGSVERDVVTALQPPRPAVLSKEVGLLHQQVGFVGRVFVADRGGIVVVIGENVDGSPRIAVTRKKGR